MKKNSSKRAARRPAFISRAGRDNACDKRTACDGESMHQTLCADELAM